jgi:hypothetical protein
MRGVSRSSRPSGAGCGGRIGLQRGLILARTNDPVRTVKPCGPGIPVLMPSLARTFRGRRGQERRSPGRARSSRSNYRAGKAGCPARTCGDCRLLFFCRRAMGAACTRPSLCPLSLRGQSLAHSSGSERAARLLVYAPVGLCPTRF